MKFHILDRKSAHEFVKEYPEIPIIVIKETCNPQSSVQEILNKSKNSLYLIFDDIETSKYSKNVTPPSRKDIEKVLAWAVNKEEIAVSCQLGISRSSAIAYIIACSKLDTSEALSFLNKNYHSPNQLIIKIGSEILNKPEIYSNFIKWMCQSVETNKFV